MNLAVDGHDLYQESLKFVVSYMRLLDYDKRKKVAKDTRWVRRRIYGTRKFLLMSDQIFRGNIGKKISIDILICIATTPTTLVNPHQVELAGTFFVN